MATTEETSVAIETEFDQARLARRLRQARKQARLTQAAVAGVLDVSPSAVNQYEAGKRRVDAITLERLGRLYGLPLRHFFHQELTYADWEESLLAATADVPPDARAGVTLLMQAMHDLMLLYEHTGAVPMAVPHPPFASLPESPMAPADVALWAGRARSYFDLGSAPLTNLRGFLEAQGFTVVAVPLGGGEAPLSGLYFRHPDLGPILVLNADQAYTRRQETIAHEFAHALFHSDRPVVVCRRHDPRPLEQFGDRFASCFLVPPEALRGYLGRHGWVTAASAEQVVHLAQYFGTSFHAMCHRLMEEGYLAADEVLRHARSIGLARTLGYHLSPYELGERPLPPEERLPRVFLDLARAAMRQRLLSAQRVAEMLGISELELEDRLAPPPR